MSHGETSTDTASFPGFSLAWSCCFWWRYMHITPKSQTLPHFTNLKSIFAYQNSTSSSLLSSFNLLFQVQKIVQNQSSSTTSWDQSCIVSHGHIYWRAWWQAGGVLIAAAAVLVLSTALFHGKSTPTTPKPVPTSNMRVPQNQAVEEMNTLRFFPNQTDNNCYVIPLKFPGFNHIVHAGFYYGIYDSLSKPPTFDLKVDRENGRQWTLHRRWMEGFRYTMRPFVWHAQATSLCA